MSKHTQFIHTHTSFLSYLLHQALQATVDSQRIPSKNLHSYNLQRIMAQRVGLSKKNNEFGKRLRILIKLQSIFIYYILFVYFTSIGIFLFSLYNYQPHSPLTSPRGTKRRVRGYYITHMNFSISFSNIFLPTRPHKLFSTT